MSKQRIPTALREIIKTIRGKRSRVVVEHILKHGSITTEDLENYGYKHPPRAVRDVREQGLPLEMSWTKNKGGRKIAEYRFARLGDILHGKLGGRRVYSKEFRAKVCQQSGRKCAICGAVFELRYLQLDHRVPYEVGGESAGEKADEFMAVCGSCNRAKSWSCEHCENWRQKKDPKTCRSCYWASPERYTHVAMRDIRRLDIAWQGSEVAEYDKIALNAIQQKAPIPEFVKRALKGLFGT
jgi:hypothetical protein